MKKKNKSKKRNSFLKIKNILIIILSIIILVLILLCFKYKTSYSSLNQNIDDLEDLNSKLRVNITNLELKYDYVRGVGLFNLVVRYCTVGVINNPQTLGSINCADLAEKVIYAQTRNKYDRGRTDKFIKTYVDPDSWNAYVCQFGQITKGENTC